MLVFLAFMRGAWLLWSTHEQHPHPTCRAPRHVGILQLMHLGDKTQIYPHRAGTYVWASGSGKRCAHAWLILNTNKRPAAFAVASLLWSWSCGGGRKWTSCASIPKTLQQEHTPAHASNVYTNMHQCSMTRALSVGCGQSRGGFKGMGSKQGPESWGRLACACIGVF